MNANTAGLLELLVCPACHHALAGLRAAMPDGSAPCTGCGAVYAVRRGIPILLPPDADIAHIHDELDHSHAHKQQQAGYFDREVAAEFEIERPHAAPETYRWLMAEKFRRSIAGLPLLTGMTVVDACCGSGMDAEMLARAGARVIAIDISEGCAQRAAERARRYGLDYLAVVGDVERLPLGARAMDISYVHDGLHHLAEPAHGLRELARVARVGVSINEPADALGTRVAVALGLSIDVEGAGNRVARLDPADVRGVLAAEGFDAASRRYLMYYRHEPGAVMRLASRPVARRAYRGAFAAANAVAGRWGNKLQVTALRRAA